MTAADPIAFVQAVLLEDATGTEIDGVDVRAGKLENSDEPPVILLEDSGWLRHDQLPAFLPAFVSVTAYGRTEAEASSLLRAASDILHRLRNRVIDGVGVWRAFDTTGPQPRDEPDTRWPARFCVVSLSMPDVALSVVS